MKVKLPVILVVLALFLGVAAPALAVDQVVLRVVSVQTDDVDGYLREINKGKALLKRLGSPSVVRVWRARFAGENAGRLVVSVEYPSLVAFAADETKVSADAEYQAWIKGLSKVRRVVSDSLYNELKP
jgi:hypothetical protein